jgi:hypothetical protein
VRPPCWSEGDEAGKMRLRRIDEGEASGEMRAEEGEIKVIIW